MGVECPGCGRQYDVTLFEFGRTIHCTCGDRVAHGASVRSHEEPDDRFVTDSMLERLARWLRLLGVDCEHSDGEADEELVRGSIRDRRWLLTGDRDLPVEWRSPWIHVVEARQPIAQLREVVVAFDLAEAARPFSRCSRCNAVLLEAAAEEAAARVPPRALENHQEFHRCPACERFYWAGSHTDEIRRVIADVLGR